MRIGRIRTFTEIEDTEEEFDEEGRFIPLEERIPTSANVFFENGISTPENDGEKLLLRLAMGRLTKRQRQVIKSMYFDGKSQKQVAEDLGVIQSVVCRHHDRALKKLRKVCLHD